MGPAQRQRRVSRRDDAAHGAVALGEHGRGAPRTQGWASARCGHRAAAGDQVGARQGRLSGPGDLRGLAAGAHRRLQRAGQRRPRGRALRAPPRLHASRTRPLCPQSTPPKAAGGPRERRRHERDAQCRARLGHGPPRRAAAPSRGRQDRDLAELSRRLVRRLHGPSDDGGLGRQRRWAGDEPRRGRQPPRRDLAGGDAGGA